MISCPIEFKDCCRAVKRGLGPLEGVAPFDLDRVVELSVGQRMKLQKAMVAQGPVNMVVVVSWWMLREIELANVRRADITVKTGPGLCRVGELLLPVD